MNPLIELQAYGQSFWYDNIRRRFLEDGTIRALITEDGLRGITANPSIFAKAIETGAEYGPQIMTFAGGDASADEIYRALVLTDIQKACDLFLETYHDSHGTDGFVSVEVSPYLSEMTNATIEDARTWFAAVNRPNVMIKVPATAAGIPAIRQLIAEGINVNITLMFSMAHYESVAQAYLDGLSTFLANGGDARSVASVASFFVSRVDTAVDKQLTSLNKPAAESLKGQIAIANSKVVYQRYKEIFLGDAFAELRAAGGLPQRLLWASTSTKNPDYPDTMYIDGLIGADTVNTMTPETIDAFRDHGHPRDALDEGVEEAQLALDKLDALGIDLDEVTEQLQRDGIKAFSRAFDDLMATIEDALQSTAAVSA